MYVCMYVQSIMYVCMNQCLIIGMYGYTKDTVNKYVCKLETFEGMYVCMYMYVRTQCRGAPACAAANKCGPLRSWSAKSGSGSCSCNYCTETPVYMYACMYTFVSVCMHVFMYVCSKAFVCMYVVCVFVVKRFNAYSMFVCFYV